MLNALIISKDRACQLKLLLDSIQLCVPNTFDITVNYTYSSDSYKLGYDRLKLERKDVRWIKEENLRADFISSIENGPNKITCIMTDDSVFFRPMNSPVSHIYGIMDDKTLCFSLRLGLNTIVQDYRNNSRQPQLINPEKLLYRAIRWNWTDYYWTHNYGYPIGMDGHCYRKDDLLRMTNSIDFKQFRSWEGILAGDKRHTLEYKPKMASYEHSILVNIPANNVQPGLYAGEKHPISLEELNNRYLVGDVLSWVHMDFSDIVGAHQEIRLEWK